MSSPQLQSPPGEEEPQTAALVYEYRFPPASRALSNYVRVLAVLVPLAIFTIFATVVFGRFWLVLGIVVFVTAPAGDEWLRYTRRRAGLRIDTDGGLWVETWHGSKRHWLPPLRELEVGKFAYSRSRPGHGMPTDMGFGYELIMRTEGGGTARAALPGGMRFAPGSGPRMSNEDLEQFAVVAGRWTTIKRGWQ